MARGQRWLAKRNASVCTDIPCADEALGNYESSGVSLSAILLVGAERLPHCSIMTAACSIRGVHSPCQGLGLLVPLLPEWPVIMHVYCRFLAAFQEHLRPMTSAPAPSRSSVAAKCRAALGQPWPRPQPLAAGLTTHPLTSGTSSTMLGLSA